jgi:hypothetical protein
VTDREAFDPKKTARPSPLASAGTGDPLKVVPSACAAGKKLDSIALPSRPPARKPRWRPPIFACRRRRAAFRAAAARLDINEARRTFREMLVSGLPFDRDELVAVGERALEGATDPDAGLHRVVDAIRRGLTVKLRSTPSEVFAGDRLLLRDHEQELQNDPGVKKALDELDRS